jgi:hypothetical protein
MPKVICPNCKSENDGASKYCNSCGFELPKNVPGLSQTLSIKEVKKPSRKQSILYVIIGILFSILGSYTVKQLNKPKWDKQLSKIADSLNKLCPMPVDEYSRCDSITIIANNSLQYNYTVVSNTKSEINLDTVRKYIEPSIIYNIKNGPDLKIFRNHKTTFIYNYYDKNGEFVWKLIVSPDKYK